MNKYIGGMVLSLLTTAAFAGDKFDKVRGAVGGLGETVKVDSIADAPMKGFAEVVLGAQVVYVSLDGKYLIDGQVIDMETRVNLSDVTRNGARKTMLTSERERFVFPATAERKHTVTVFTDIDCGYCRRLHQQMAGYNELGIEVNYLMFPRAGIGSASHDKAVSTWCAADRNAALTAAKSGTDPSPLQCDNPIERHFVLGQQVGVTGTPAIVASDGTLLPGYMPPETLLARLDALAGLPANLTE